MTTETSGRRRIQRLIFVYAAESGLLSAFVDSAKKLLMLKGCSLCAITHGLAGERHEWRECREEIGVPIEIFHSDDTPPEVFAVVDGNLPCVVADTGDDLVLLLRPEVIERVRGNVGDFRGRLAIHAAMRQLDLPMTPEPAAGA